MRRVEATQARQEFADTINHVAYGNKRVVLQRRGRDVAAIVSMDDLRLLQRCESSGDAPDDRRGPRDRRRAGPDRN